MNGHGPSLFAPRVGEVAKAGISAREHRQGGRHVLMPRAVARFEDAQSPSETLPRDDILPLAQPGIRERMEIQRCLVMVRAEVALGDGQGPLPQGKGQAQVAEIRQR